MSPSPPSDSLIVSYAFAISLAITIGLYFLRGLGLLTFMPGGVLYLFILLSIATAIAYGVQKTRRY